MKDSPSPQRVHDFLEHIRERNTARKQFERARIDGTSLLEWLEDTLQTTEENAWKVLLDFQTGDARRVGGLAAALTDTLRAEYLLRLIDATLAHAIKERRKEGS